MVVSVTNEYPSQIRKILQVQRGPVQTARLTEMSIPRACLSILERIGKVERVSRCNCRAIEAVEEKKLFQTLLRSVS